MSTTSANTGKSKARRPSASKYIARPLLEAATNGTAWTAHPTVTATKPTTGAIDTSDFPMARLIFAGTDAANETYNYRIVLWHPLDDGVIPQWIPTVIAEGVVTLGAVTLPASVIAANGKLADTLTDTIGQSGTIVRSEGSDSVAALDVDLRNAMVLTVETDIVTATNAYVFVQLGENFGGSAGDEDTGTLLEVTRPTVITPLAVQGPQTGNGWDSVTEGAITALAEWVDVYVDNPAHIMPTASASDPAQNGAIYAGGMTHRIRCFGMTHLHIKNGTAGSNVTATATVYGN